ncbi:HNH endonuclease [Devosia rhodophyticola]|uniref:HNH endonuclease n=1 Tax=Devosia rhodophyticola TaxID=3026423 RepID=A0ABY7Z0V7_9HYPH|nr:HNH endonuclease [Devosia rhodophyticola]WDR07112.1 HNH endonuclease [Devosia rhodophyticola]
MSFGIFIHRADSIYNDSPAERYQFPKRYLKAAKSCVGDWIVYYEPTKVLGTKGYYAVAQIAEIVRDESAHDMYLAYVKPGSYLEFANPVPFNLDDGLAETGLLNANGQISGLRQSAVRPLSARDFNRIVGIGLADIDVFLPRVDDVEHSEPLRSEFDDEQAPFEYEQERVRHTALTSRVVRDKVFRRVILRAYDERCAVTGLKLINGGGRAEVEAAHIRPVEANGPDIVNNGMALSGTAHWMFDRGLIGLADNQEIMISRHVNDRDGVESMINTTGRLIGPLKARDGPHPAFLAWHRDNCFKH